MTNIKTDKVVIVGPVRDLKESIILDQILTIGPCVRPLYKIKMELCDNEVNENLERFHEESLVKLSRLLLGKTIILPGTGLMAHIVETEMVMESKLTKAGTHLTSLLATAEMLVGDIDKFYKVVVGKKRNVVFVACDMYKRVCCLCGEEQCDHQKGIEYNGKLAFWELLEPTKIIHCCLY